MHIFINLPLLILSNIYGIKFNHYSYLFKIIQGLLQGINNIEITGSTASYGQRVYLNTGMQWQLQQEKKFHSKFEKAFVTMMICVIQTLRSLDCYKTEMCPSLVHLSPTYDIIVCSSLCRLKPDFSDCTWEHVQPLRSLDLQVPPEIQCQICHLQSFIIRFCLLLDSQT